MDQNLARIRVTRTSRSQPSDVLCGEPLAVHSPQPFPQVVPGPVGAPYPARDALLSFLEASRATAEAESLSEALQTIVWRAAEALDMSECIAYEYDSSSDCIIPRASFERVPSGWEGLGEPLSLSVYAAERAALESAEPLLERISDPELALASFETMHKWGEKTCLTIPLLIGSERMGLLAFYDTERERDFDEAEMAVARGLAALAGQAMHTAQLLRRMEERNRRLAALLQANRAISSSLNLDEVLGAVANHVAIALGCEECAIYQSDEDRLGGSSTEAGILPWPHVLQQRLDDVDLDPAVRVDMEAQGDRSRLVIPLVFGRSKLGTMVIRETSDDRVFADEDIDLVRGLAEQAGLAIHNARQYQDLRAVHVSGLRALVSALGAKERYTQGHAARVSHYVALMGAKLGWSEDAVHRAEEASVMHDIGKLAVSDSILLKPGPLSEHEWTVVRAHPETSEEILRPMVEEDLLRAIRHHHEKYDGSGYPDGLAGDEIPLLARAMSVADAYDAMSFRRSYRRSLSYRECRRELERGRGSQFDPEMVDALLQVLEDISQRRKYCIGVATQAARLIDGDKHKLLRKREDEDRTEYQEIAGILRAVLTSSTDIRFLTTLTRDGLTYIFVVDSEENEEWKSHAGDELLVVDEEMDHVFAGERQLNRNVLNADEFGVWISGWARVYDSEGEIVALVCADSPASPSPDQFGFGSGPGFLASLLGEAGKRVTRAEFDAATDSLTGLYNHRFLHEHLAEEISRSTHRQSSFAVLFFDIDHFKRFNDLYGHSFGDAVLRAVAQVIEGEVRRGDVVARYGGEEFVAVLADTDLAGGCAVAERIRRKIGRSPLVAGGPPITVSVGVAVFPTDGTSKADLIERADSAMYQAKRLGRDRVHAYSADAAG